VVQIASAKAIAATIATVVQTAANNFLPKLTKSQLIS